MDYKTPTKLYKFHQGPARFFLDLGDGSERGEYVNQDYILHTLGRTHRAISLMYCYYPNDEGWPLRVRDAFKDRVVKFQWDYPYEDYFPYQGGLKGDLNKEPFNQMRDIRRHGQDVILTMTIDPNLDDEQLRSIGRDLKSFGRMELRINHEATGDWFAFTKRASYADIAKFFVRASKLIKEEAPNVKTVACIGGIEDLNSTEIVMEKEFKCTIPEADIWSVDKYLALHWGWPYDVAEKGGNSFARYAISDVYEKTKRSFYRYKELNGGVAKPMVMSELNADGDVTGPYDQCKMIEEFVKRVKEDEDEWFSGFTFYQFRDRGRLGLEIEDPNNSEVGIRQPLMDAYIKLLNDKDFLPKVKRVKTLKSENGKFEKPVKLRYGASNDCEGIAMEFKLEKNPEFFELYFDEENVNDNILIEINGSMIYKAPGVKCVDLMEAFFKKPLKKGKNVTMRMVYPPASGENDLKVKDGLLNTYTKVAKLPSVRIEYLPIVEKA
ncbi:MAG: hypothetical protein MJ113_06315 [Lachnospiraceae bacterium]|nr:hypothetical protein [Lachnospiraceae bacterium]